MATSDAPKRAKKVALSKPPSNEGKKKRTPAAKKSTKKRTTAAKKSTPTKSAPKKRAPAKKSATTKKTAAKKTTTKKTVQKPAAKKASAKKRVTKPAAKTGESRLPKNLQDDGKLHRGKVIRYFCTHDTEVPDGYYATVFVCSQKCFEVAHDTLVKTFNYKEDDLRIGNIQIMRSECMIHPLLNMSESEMDELMKGTDDE